jgi:hypothetical protein
VPDSKVLAGEYGAAFVVGIIDNRPVLPYSSAYLITETRCCRLARKVGEDSLAKGTKPHLYRGCRPNREECDTPTIYEGIAVAALICMNAFKEELGETLR